MSLKQKWAISLQIMTQCTYTYDIICFLQIKRISLKLFQQCCFLLYYCFIARQEIDGKEMGGEKLEGNERRESELEGRGSELEGRGVNWKGEGVNWKGEGAVNSNSLHDAIRPVKFPFS